MSFILFSNSPFSTYATPFLHFTQYEVESPQVLTLGNGLVATTTYTATYNLSAPQAYPLSNYNLDGVVSATGRVPSPFLTNIPATGCAAGTWAAVPTLIIVVDLILGAEAVLAEVRTFSPAYATAVATKSKTTAAVYTLATASSLNVPHSFAVGSLQPGQIGISCGEQCVISSYVTQTASSDSTLLVPTSFVVAAPTAGTPPQADNAPQARLSLYTPPASIDSIATTVRQPEGISVLAVSSSVQDAGTNPDLQPLLSLLGIAGQSYMAQTMSSMPSSTVALPPAYTTVGSSLRTPGTAMIPARPSVNLPVTTGASTETSSQAGILPVLAINGQNYVLGTDGTYYPVLGDVTAPEVNLANGAAVMSNGLTINLSQSGSWITVNGVAYGVSSSPAIPVLSINGQTYEISGDGNYHPISSLGTVSIKPITIVPGQTLTLAGNTLTLSASGSSIDINNLSYNISTNPNLTIPSAGAFYPPIITVGSKTYTADANKEFVVAGQTLMPGGAITVSGTTVSLAPAATVVVINGQTADVKPASVSAAPTISAKPVLVVGTNRYTAVTGTGTGTAYVVDGQTLTPGGLVTVSGSTISLLLPSPTGAVVGGGGSGASSSTTSTSNNYRGTASATHFDGYTRLAMVVAIVFSFSFVW